MPDILKLAPSWSLCLPPSTASVTLRAVDLVRVVVPVGRGEGRPVVGGEAVAQAAVHETAHLQGVLDLHSRGALFRVYTVDSVR